MNDGWFTLFTNILSWLKKQDTHRRHSQTTIDIKLIHLCTLPTNQPEGSNKFHMHGQRHIISEQDFYGGNRAVRQPVFSWQWRAQSKQAWVTRLRCSSTTLRKLNIENVNKLHYLLCCEETKRFGIRKETICWKCFNKLAATSVQFSSRREKGTSQAAFFPFIPCAEKKYNFQTQQAKIYFKETLWNVSLTH